MRSGTPPRGRTGITLNATTTLDGDDYGTDNKTRKRQLDVKAGFFNMSTKAGRFPQRASEKEN